MIGFSKMGKVDRVLCALEAIFLVGTCVFGFLGAKALRGGSPMAYEFKQPCVSSTMRTWTCGGQDNSTCMSSGGKVSNGSACPAEIAIKACKVYFSKTEIASVSAKATLKQVPIATVKAEVAKVGRGFTEWDNRCGFTNDCEPVKQLVFEKPVVEPVVPETFLWFFYKLIALAPGIVDAILRRCTCNGGSNSGAFEKIIAFGGGLYWCTEEGGCIRWMCKKLGIVIKYLKFKTMPNILLSELSSVVKHPTCPDMAISRGAGFAFSALVMVGLVLYTFTATLVSIAVMSREKVLTQAGELAIAKYDYHEGIASKCLMLSMLFMFFLDLCGALVAPWFYLYVWSEAGMILGFNFSVMFSFDIGFALTLDLFQFAFTCLSITETIQFIKDAVGGCAKVVVGNDTAEKEAEAEKEASSA